MAEKILLTSSDWTTKEGTVGLTSDQITKPAELKNVATVMIQADKDNKGCIAFGSVTGVTMSANLGGKLSAGQIAVLPINLEREAQELYVIADRASQNYFVSYFTGGDLC